MSTNSLDRNNSLDTLRGVAILMVISVHASQLMPSILPPLGKLFSYFGASGVQLFFIASGYTMMLSYKANQKNHIWAFYIRRLSRIAPMYWVAILIYSLRNKFSSGFFAPNGVEISDLLLNISFLHSSSLTAYNSVVPGGWSVGTEMLFYAFFPLIFIGISGGRTKSILTLLIIILVSAGSTQTIIISPWLESIFTPLQNERYLLEIFLFFWLPKQIICFAFGIAIFKVQSKETLGEMWLISLSLAAIIHGEWGLIVVGLALLAWVFIHHNISFKVVSYIGVLSYSIYLLHFFFLTMVARWKLPLEIGMPLAIAFTTLLARLTKNKIEDRFIELGRELCKKLN